MILAKLTPEQVATWKTLTGRTRSPRATCVRDRGAARIARCD